jgi:small GTP-binding protein
VIKKKICMTGMYGVGKTSLVRRFVESIYEDRYLTTIGVKIDKKTVAVDGVDVMLAIWDMAGEDEIAQARLSHLRGAQGYILVADGTRRASLDKAVDLNRRIAREIGDLPFVLVVNKNDLRGEWEVQPADLEALGWQVYESSAKTGEGVEDVFQMLAGRIMAQHAVRTADDGGEG